MTNYRQVDWEQYEEQAYRDVIEPKKKPKKQKKSWKEKSKEKDNHRDKKNSWSNNTKHS